MTAPGAPPPGWMSDESQKRQRELQQGLPPGFYNWPQDQQNSWLLDHQARTAGPRPDVGMVVGASPAAGTPLEAVGQYVSGNAGPVTAGVPRNPLATSELQDQERKKREADRLRNLFSTLPPPGMGP